MKVTDWEVSVFENPGHTGGLYFKHVKADDKWPFRLTVKSVGLSEEEIKFVLTKEDMNHLIESVKFIERLL